MKKIYLISIILVLVIISYPRKSSVNYFSEIINLRKESVSILNFGDVMFDRGVRNIIENKNRDPFEYIKNDLNLFKNYDVRIVNLEGPIVTMDRKLCQQKAYNFQFADETLDRLKSIGINMVNIANNHFYDCYNEGLVSTKSKLTFADIEYIGDNVYENSFVVKNINGKKVAFVGMDETVQFIPLSSFYDLVEKLKSENDYVVVNIHWGTEYKLESNENQKIIAHKLIDSGADVIFGHHPHVVEEVEVYKDRPIFYSLGNFVFDQNFGDTTVGLGAGVHFLENKIQIEIYPFNIKLFAPDLMKGLERENYCKKYLVKFQNQDCRFEIKI